MRFEVVLPFAALATAIVIPDEAMIAQVPYETAPELHSLWDRLPDFSDIKDKIKTPFKHEAESLRHPLDEALSEVKEHGCKKDHKGTGFKDPTFDYQAWIEHGLKKHDSLKELDFPNQHGPPHKRPRKPRLHWPHWPHHPHHHTSNLTIYELISKSNYTKILASYIDKDSDLVKSLNSTKANYTIFAPVDSAFEKLPKDFKPSKELIRKVLSYHVLPGLYSTRRLGFTKTAPTLLELDSLGGNPQRVLFKWLGFFRGWRINYFSKLLVGNIGASNGLIHGLSNILFPPPPALAIISHLPTTFSTLELGLVKAELIDALNSSSSVGLTLFAPTNDAFKKLGPRINGFLFSKFGQKYLKALLQYHIAPNATLYSTHYDPPKGTAKDVVEFFDQAPSNMEHGCPHSEHVDKKGLFDFIRPSRPGKPSPEHHAPLRQVHIDLPTLLEGHPLPIDITRRGPFVFIKVNGWIPVAVPDGLAADGVIHVVTKVLIPPKNPGSKAVEAPDTDITLEELVERLEPYVKSGDKVVEAIDGVDEKWEF